MENPREIQRYEVNSKKYLYGVQYIMKVFCTHSTSKMNLSRKKIVTSYYTPTFDLK